MMPPGATTTGCASITCTGCGASAELKYSGDIGERMERDTSCFTCAFWQQVVEQVAEHPEESVRVNGAAFTISPDLPDGRPRTEAAFSGSEFVIAFHDGRRVVTHNLWHRGPIPEHFRGELPDNATWETSS